MCQGSGGVIMKLQKLEDQSFSRYGKIVENLPSDKLLEIAKGWQMPESGVSYERSVDELENTDEFALIRQGYGGYQPLEAGLCWGYNKDLNSLEYHRASELMIAATDLILMLGDRCDLDQGRYDTSKIEAFFVPAGKAVELYATTLHYAPCQASASGFKAVVVLPAATNAPLTSGQIETVKQRAGDWEDKLLFAVDKWLTAHPDSDDAKNNNAFPGLEGKNLTTDDFSD